MANISEKLFSVDFVLTCEKTIDKQTIFGKGPRVIAKFVHDQKVACIGLCGQLGHAFDLKISFFDAVFPIKKKLFTPIRAMEKTSSYLFN